MFTSEWVESKENCIVLEGLTHFVFKSVLEFIYTGQFNVPAGDKLLAEFSVDDDEEEKSISPSEDSNSSSQVSVLSAETSCVLSFYMAVLSAADYLCMPSLAELCGHAVTKIRLDDNFHYCTLDDMLDIYQCMQRLGLEHCEKYSLYILVDFLAFHIHTQDLFSRLPDEIQKAVNSVRHDKLEKEYLLGANNVLADVLETEPKKSSVRSALEDGAEPNAILALHTYLDNYHMKASSHQEEMLEAFVELLDHGGCDVNLADHAGNTPLHIAALEGAVDELNLLLEKDADVTKLNNHGRTPLQEAAAHVRLSGHHIILLFSLHNGHTGQ